MAFKLSLSFVGLLSLLEVAVAQSGPWGQCGGSDWPGPTTCVSGWTCTYSNPWYSQCLQGSSTVASSTAVPSTTTSKTTTISSTASPTSTSTSPSGTGLAVIAAAAGKTYFGSATDNPELSDTAYVAQLSNLKDFNQLTAGNSMKWDATEPSRGTFTFTNGDVIANLAKKNGQLLRGMDHKNSTQLRLVQPAPQLGDFWQLQQCHPSVYCGDSLQHCCLPLQGANLYVCFMNEYPHLANPMFLTFADSWDVVNEPFNDDGTWRTSVFGTTIGPSYVNVALNAARAADPAAKLYINDYNLEYNSDKTTAMVNLVKSLLAAGTPIDGVGFQGHLIVGQVPSGFKAAMQQFTDLGLEVAITELDIRMTLPATAALLAQQKADYQNVISICNSLPKCIGVTIWDYTDKYSWVPNTFSGQGAALPWDANLAKKPAYDGIVAGFQ
ncbi:hypothetical protein D9619_004095 [Psilocybe cf. subviscida]|uniref:Beta-xylanase n=1 Tax=Psilocybe cf. subviscida TaxID=2480587 RepID=A0A8H5BPU5_9AGAR|nr:hypothetical protein D9619_004095 [Psilocybe cf. subviscida]